MQALRGTRVKDGVREYGLINHVATNGFEMHVGFTKEKTTAELEAKKRQKVKEEDAALFASAQHAANVARQGDERCFYHSGTVGVDPGMGGLAFASHSTVNEEFLWNAALEHDSLDRAATEGLPDKEKHGRFEAELRLRRVTHERQQNKFERQIAKRRAAYVAAGAKEEVLLPNESWAKSTAANISSQFSDFRSNFEVRSGFFRDRLFARQSLFNSGALSLLAAQTCDMAEIMVGRMGEAAEKGSDSTEAASRSTAKVDGGPTKLLFRRPRLATTS